MRRASTPTSVAPVTIVGDLRLAPPVQPTDFDLPLYLFPELAASAAFANAPASPSSLFASQIDIVSSRTVPGDPRTGSSAVIQKTVTAVDAVYKGMLQASVDGGCNKWEMAPLETPADEAAQEQEAAGGDNGDVRAATTARSGKKHRSAVAVSLQELVARNYMPDLMLDDGIFSLKGRTTNSPTDEAEDDAAEGSPATAFTSETLLRELTHYARAVQQASAARHARYVRATGGGAASSTLHSVTHAPLPPPPPLSDGDLQPLLSNHFLNVLAFAKLRELNSAATSAAPGAGAAASSLACISDKVKQFFSMERFHATRSTSVQCTYHADPSLLGLNTMLPVASFDERVAGATAPYGVLFAPFLTAATAPLPSASTGGDQGGWGLRIWTAGSEHDTIDGATKSPQVVVPLRTPQQGSGQRQAFNWIGRDAGSSSSSSPNAAAASFAPAQHARVDIGLRGFTHAPKTVAPLHCCLVATAGRDDGGEAPATAGDGDDAATAAGPTVMWSLVVFGRNGVRVGHSHVFEGPFRLPSAGYQLAIGDVRMEVVAPEN